MHYIGQQVLHPVFCVCVLNEGEFNPNLVWANVNLCPEDRTGGAELHQREKGCGEGV